MELGDLAGRLGDLLGGQRRLRDEAVDPWGQPLHPDAAVYDPPDLVGRLRRAIQLIRFRRKVSYWKASGIRFGRGVHVMPSAFFDTSYGWMISIGDGTRIAESVRILVHDASPQPDLGYGKVGPVTIGASCFIAEGSVILPGVTIGDRSMIGAGSVVAADVPPGSRAMGVPARTYGTVEAYLEETRQAIERCPRFRYQELWKLSPAEREDVLLRLREAGNRGFHFDPFSASPFYVTPP